MKSPRDPRLLIASLLLLVAVAFLGGTMRLIRRARAAEQPVLLAGGAFIKGESTRVAVEPAADRSGIPLASSPDPAGVTSGLSAQATATPVQASADTGGIIALAIVIVVTIILGAVIGVRKSIPRQTAPK
jgi:hypothetical protein